MLSAEGSLGDRMKAKIQIGDLVSWKMLGDDENRGLGVILDFFHKEEGGRHVIYADIFHFRGAKKVIMPVISLKRYEGVVDEV